MRVRQTRPDLTFAGVEWVSPGVVRVLRGTKHVRASNGWQKASAGQLLFIPAGTRLDVRNELDDGLYEAEGIVFSLDLEPAPPRAAAAGRAPELGILARTDHPELEGAMTRALGAFADKLPVDIQRLRVLEVVAWLRELGIDPLLASPSVRLRLKRLLAADPAHPWLLPAVASAMAMSEDTLQRHLRREGSGFQQLLVEVRMEHALTLLWTTQLPLAMVASQSGYESTSRFAERFRERFDVLPSELRRRRSR